MCQNLRLPKTTEMSIRKYSTDNSSDNDSESGLNRAILMSDNQSLFMEKSVTAEQTFGSPYGFNRYSVKSTMSSRNSSDVKFSAPSNDKTILSDKASQGDCSRSQNTKTSLPVGDEFEVKVSGNLSGSCRITSQEQSENLSPESRKLKIPVSKPRIINEEMLLDRITIVSNKGLNDNLSTHEKIHEQKELMKRHNNFIKKFDNYLSGSDVKTKGEPLSPGSDASSNASEAVEEFTANNLEGSNIWPALNALETTFTKADGNTSKDHTDIIDSLRQRFSYSPRSFTEMLLTIIEESFVEPEEASPGFHQFLKRSEGAEILEEISSSKLVYSQTSGEFTDAAAKSDSHEPRLDSTEYKSLKKLMSPNEQAKIHRRSLKLHIGSESPIKIQRLNEISPIKCSAEKQNYPKTPPLIKEPGSSRKAPADRLGVGSARSIRKNSRRRRNSIKAPQIVIDPGTPQSQRKNRRFSIQSWDDDEYLTAESECEEPESIQSEKLATIETEEPATIEIEGSFASSSRKLNMSSIAYHHREWKQAYEEVSKYESVIHRSTSAITKTKETHTKKLKTLGLRKLQHKRQQCLDLIDQLIEKKGNVDASIQEQTSLIYNSEKSTTEFFNILRACSEYFTYGMNGRDVCQSTVKTSRHVSSLSVNIKKKKDLSPHLSVHHGRTKSPRKSLGKKNVRVKSPGAKSLSPYRNFCSKRRSLKGLKSPGVDTSSLKPVSQLRRFFSPGKCVTGGSKCNANLPDSIPRSIAGFGFQEKRRTQRKFKHIVSPVGQYIRGSNAT